MNGVYFLKKIHLTNEKDGKTVEKTGSTSCMLPVFGSEHPFPDVADGVIDAFFAQLALPDAGVRLNA